MKKISRMIAAVLSFTLYCGGVALAEHHPNLESAQRLMRQADARILAAKQAHEFATEGEAQTAKDLMKRADEQLKLANPSYEGANQPLVAQPAKGMSNLVSARRLMHAADLKIIAAEKAHEFATEGEAQTARDLVRRADEELKKANKALSKH